jgi:2'-5' RNA ligase
MPRRTALIIEVPEAEPAVGDVRWQHDPSAALGVPAHITVLFPFGEVDEDELAALIARWHAFDFALERVETFDNGVVWLFPRPMRPFADLTEAIAQRWPQFPPYEGEFDEPVPHLTVSMSPIDFQPQLPIAARAHEVTWIEEGDDGRWTVRRRFPFSA